VNEDAIEPSTEGVPPEPTEPTEPVEKVESADTSSVKTSQEQISELEKKAMGNPLTKLRFSQYNLFSTTAGPFRGPGDPYYKFVLGGRSIRQGAKLLQKYKTAEVDQGKFDELLIDKSLNRYSTPAYNHKTLFKMRDKKKQSIELAIHSKVDNLEKMRAYIITTMHSLQSHKALLHDLMNQHDILKKQYQETLRDINERVSTTLATNEESMIQIKTLEHDKAIERKRLVKEFARLMRHWEEEERLVEEHRNCLQKAYDEKTRDLEDLMEFEVIMIDIASIV
jgi:hypothetical protein